MTRSSVNFIVDAVVALLFLCVLGVASIVHFIFPAPSRAQGWSVWGRDLDRWTIIEVVTISLFAIAVLVHLSFHWTWVCGFITARVSKRTRHRITMTPSVRTLYGVCVLVCALTVLAAVYTAASFATLEPPAS